MVSSSESSLSATLKHGSFCIVLFSWIFAFCYHAKAIRFGVDPVDLINPWTEYGYLLTIFLTFIRLLTFLGLPQTMFNLTGFVCFRCFSEKIDLKSSPLLAPFICVRVVTRGTYPRLVKETVTKNLETLMSVGFENFIIEVVTDVRLHMDGFHPRVRETVVPSSYQSKAGSLNKSRALQYCLEDDVNMLDDNDWIVHLDEETLLTERSVKGILNFIVDGKHDCGQGLITYAGCGEIRFKSWAKTVQNRICTVADSFRVADDMGKLRCQFKLFNKPIFSWKGSYVVNRAGSERRVTFDFGPEGSKAEDCFFAMVAMDKGLTFDFIEGEMLEKSPFTFKDFFKQRKRWMQGIYMVVASEQISWPTKGFLAMSLLSWLTLPLSTMNVFFSQMYPMSIGPLADFGLGFLGAMGLFMYGFGYIKQHPIHRYSWLRLLMVGPEIVIASILGIIVENLAVCTMWFGDWYDFYIVEKEVDQETPKEKEEEEQNLLPSENTVQIV